MIAVEDTELIMSDNPCKGHAAAGNGITNGVCQLQSLSINDLESATVHNNYEFVSKWLKRFTLEERDGEIYRKRCGNLLRRASFCHSVDVVKCIVSMGSCDGEIYIFTNTVQLQKGEDMHTDKSK